MTYSSTKKLPLVRHLEKKRKATKIALRLNRLHSIAYIRNGLYGITSFAATETIVGSGKGKEDNYIQRTGLRNRGRDPGGPNNALQSMSVSTYPVTTKSICPSDPRAFPFLLTPFYAKHRGTLEGTIVIVQISQKGRISLFR